LPFEWKPQQGEIARRVYPKDVQGTFKKEIIASEFQRIFLIQDGVIKDILSQGKHDVGGLLVKDRTAVCVDFSDKDLLYGFSDIRLGDGVVIKCNGEIRFRIHDPQLFYVNLFASRDVLTLDDLWTRLQLELKDTLSPILYQHRAEDIYGDPAVKNNCYTAIEMEMRKTFQRWGFELIQFTLNPVFPEEWINMEKKRIGMVADAKLRGVVKCPKCGESVPGGAIFCPACGTKVGGSAT
jgi:hypothetical protein